MADSTRFDVIIVGSGPAGCVLASRLTEDVGRKVLLIEAGPDYGGDSADWPPELLDSTTVPTESHPWGFQHVPRDDAGDLGLPRGRVVGGTSTINGCIWLRGSAADFDAWAAAGNPGWSFNEIQELFTGAESDPLGGALHGANGPVPVHRVTEAALTPVDQLLIESAMRLGIPFVDDHNDAIEQRPGIGPTPKNIKDGSRMNGALTYLAPVRDRENLTILPDRLVDVVTIEEGRATGVRLSDGVSLAAHEVILAAGAYGSPAILMRSGIGPTSHLTRLGIPVVQDLPGVGQNLRDHPMVGFGNVQIAQTHAPAGRTFMPIIVKGRSDQADDEIDFHIYQGQSIDGPATGWTLWMSISLQDARSEGTVRLTSRDPEAELLIDHRYFSDAHDLEAMCDGLELARRLVDTAPLGAVVTNLDGQTASWTSRTELRRYARSSVGTTFHPSSTCKMGPESDSTSVVDHQGRVHGVDRLRVVDASIFPTGPRCNLHFPIVVAAEKIARDIRGG